VIYAGPKWSGDRIPHKRLLPNNGLIQRKIVTYHNYFRSRVQPPAGNMLKMVRFSASIYGALSQTHSPLIYARAPALRFANPGI
jgi:hypothetical protein